MSKPACIAIAFFACLLFAGCSDTAGDDAVPVTEPATVNLRIDVALADISEVVRSTRGYEDAEGPNEKMQMLRIVIVRPDGTVEANRLIELATAATEHGYESFKVIGKETKQVYIFVNERTTVPDNGVNRRLAPEALNRISVGQAFPATELTEATIQLNGADELLVGALPMSDCHEVYVPDIDVERTLFVTRAAVKFSFLIINETSRTISLEELSIDKMARREYYLPRVSEYGKEHEIVEYDVPLIENNEYYTFRKEIGRTAKIDEKIALSPIYLLEGKYRDADDIRNYKLSLKLNGSATPYGYFDQLPQLPRNTHAVVTITVRDTEINWEVDIVPYGEKALFPIFGLDG